MQNQFDENGRWALVATAIILAILWVFLGDSPKPNNAPKRKRSPAKAEQSAGEEEPSLDIPEVVTKDDLDGATLRERKMA